MEAPEKIYLYTSDRAGYEWDEEWADKPLNEDSVEYTRTDAFIEKALDWLRTHSEADYFELISVGNYCGAGNLNKKKMIEDFRNYLKGE